MGLLAKVFLWIILLHHLPWCSGYVQGNENNAEEVRQRINRQLISGGGHGGGRSGSSSSHGSGSASRKSPSGSGTASKKSPFTPYGAVYAAGAANHHTNNNNNNHRNIAAPLSCNRNNFGLLFTALVVAILLVVASS